MTEKEKMLNGLLYDPFEAELLETRTKCHKLCLEYNLLPDTETDKRNALLKEILPVLNEGVYLQGPIQIDCGKNLYIGKFSYANYNFVVLDEGKIEIGENVFMGPNVTLVTAVHPLRHQDRNLFYDEKKQCYTNLEYAKPIKIGNNCWICSNVTIVGGVTIGEGCVIGAGSVVTRDIPPYSLAFGNPCRVKRKIDERDNLKNHQELFI